MVARSEGWQGRHHHWVFQERPKPHAPIGRDSSKFVVSRRGGAKRDE